MDKNRWKKISRIIDAALTVPEKSRFSFVQTYCEGDDSLLEEVYDLLRSLESGGDSSILDSHLQKNRALLSETYNKDSISAEFKEGSTIGDWELIQLLGRGGMGTVFKAKRLGNIEQLGALKILHHHLNTPEHLHRFRQEQQILAGLHHPNITQFIEGGISDEGLPFLVMEFIEGKPLAEYCDEHRLSVDERISLFINVCNAVQYAHKKLVVHRDLKPDNILITNDGNVKVLDFGIAKLLDSNLFQLPFSQTREGLRLMSLEYASPEQVNGEPVSVSTDIYALGMLLSELLTGIHPLEQKGKTYREMVNVILNDEIPAPSQILRQYADSAKLKDISFKRSAYPSELIKALRGDLDAITGKTIRKEPEHRYDSVVHFLEDIERYRKTKPVLARRGSVSYRTNKFLKRNRSILAPAAIILFLIPGFGLFHLNQVTQERNTARIEAEKATRIKDFTTTLFAAGNPYNEENRQGMVTANQLLETGLMNIEAELIHEPEIYAEMHQVIGRALLGLGEYERSKDSVHKALEKNIQLYGGTHPAIAENMLLLAQLQRILGEYDSAFEWAGKALQMNEQLHGEISKEVAVNYRELGTIYNNSMSYDLAAENFNKALHLFEELGEENSLQAIFTLRSLADVQSRNGLYDEAESNLLASVEELKKIYGENHLQLANTYSSLASLYSLRSNFNKSEEYYQKVLELRKGPLSDDHPHHIRTLSAYGLVLYRMGNYPESEKMQTEALGLFEKHALTDSLDYIAILNRLALVKSANEEFSHAADIYNEALHIMQNYLEPDHSEKTVVLYNLADVYYKMNELARARQLFEQVVERDKNVFGDDHPEVAIDLVKLASVTRDMQDYEQSERLFSEAENIFSEKFIPGHHRTGEFLMEYGKLKMMINRYEDAAGFFEKSIAIFEKNYEPGHKNLLEARDYLDQVFLKIDNSQVYLPNNQ